MGSDPRLVKTRRGHVEDRLFLSLSIDFEMEHMLVNKLDLVKCLTNIFSQHKVGVVFYLTCIIPILLIP